ncbi:Rho GTPase-activating protein 15 [Phlyctochytrium planicorne]|nr:Rho GTPase-activating protein 15 [Phlyctochytrium planicorne]
MEPASKPQTDDISFLEAPIQDLSFTLESSALDNSQRGEDTAQTDSAAGATDRPKPPPIEDPSPAALLNAAKDGSNAVEITKPALASPVEPGTVEEIGKGDAAKKVVIGRALWDYTAFEDNEISFKAGDLVEIVELCNEDWYEGKVGTMRGYFPANRVQIVSEDGPPPPEKTDVAQSNPPSATMEPTPPVSTGEPEPQEVVITPTAPAAVDETEDPESDDPFADENGELQETEEIEEIQEAFHGASIEEVVEAGSKVATATTAKFPEVESELSFNAQEEEEEEDESEQLLGGGTSVVDKQAEYAVINEDGASDLQPEEGALEPPWRWTRDEEGQVYYWNEETGERSWDPPPGVSHVDVVPLRHEKEASNDSNARSYSQTVSLSGGMASEGEDNATTDLAGMDLIVSLVDNIPADLIRREGPIKRKLKREDDGREPRMTATWKSLYAVACVGFILFYKDAPSKVKKSSPPLDIISLSNIVFEQVGKDTTSKKNAFMISLHNGNGKQWLITPEGESNIWIDTLKACSKERITPVEYESAVARLFAKSKSESDLLSIPPATKARRSTSAGKEKETIQSASDQEKGSNKSQVRSKLTAFFSKRQIANTKGKDKGSAIPEDVQGIFGSDLHADYDGRKIPEVVELCCAEIERRGILSQGIYRLSGNTTTIQKLRSQFNQNEPVRLDSEDIDINVVSGLLKLFFRELPNPLIPFEFYEPFIKAAKIESYNDRLIELKNLIQSLPHPNYNILEYLMRHLCIVAANSEVNKMERSNLAIVFAPTLIRNPEEGGQVGYSTIANMPFHNTIIEAMLEQFEWLFDGSAE